MKKQSFRRWRVSYQRNQRSMRRFLRATGVTKQNLLDEILRCWMEGHLSWKELDHQLRLFDFSNPRWTPIELSRW